MKVERGDLIQMAKNGRFDVIIHGCNCFCTMGAGIAKQIKDHFPQAQLADQKTQAGDKQKLGTYSVAHIEHKDHAFSVVNAYTQYQFSGHGTLVDYEAVRKIFAQLKNDFTKKRIAYPKIGAGLAKGDWVMISKLIDKALQGEDHTLVEYDRHTDNQDIQI